MLSWFTCEFTAEMACYWMWCGRKSDRLGDMFASANPKHKPQPQTRGLWLCIGLASQCLVSVTSCNAVTWLSHIDVNSHVDVPFRCWYWHRTYGVGRSISISDRCGFSGPLCMKCLHCFVLERKFWLCGIVCIGQLWGWGSVAWWSCLDSWISIRTTKVDISHETKWLKMYENVLQMFELCE